MSKLTQIKIDTQKKKQIVIKFLVSSMYISTYQKARSKEEKEVLLGNRSPLTLSEKKMLWVGCKTGNYDVQATRLIDDIISGEQEVYSFQCKNFLYNIQEHADHVLLKCGAGYWKESRRQIWVSFASGVLFYLLMCLLTLAFPEIPDTNINILKHDLRQKHGEPN